MANEGHKMWVSLINLYVTYSEFISGQLGWALHDWWREKTA